MLSLPILLTLTLLTLASLRLLYILRRWGPSSRRADVPQNGGAHILISLGSGGHTAEMLALLSSPPLPPSRYTRRTYVVSSGDAFSAEKAREFEARLQQTGTRLSKDQEGGGGGGNQGSYEIHTVPRARRIHQSLLTTPLSCLSCLWECIRLLMGHHGSPPPPRSQSPNTTTPPSSSSRPDLILLNGPATSLILVLASLILRYLAFLPLLHPVGEMRTIYIESWARVKTPSLTLRIISWCGLCDRVVVQHKGLEERGWGEWRGDLMR